MELLESLTYCLRLWGHLEMRPSTFNPNTASVKRTALEEIGLAKFNFAYDCPACEYAKSVVYSEPFAEGDIHRCEHCPLWCTGQQDPGFRVFCELEGSPYEDWREANNEQDRKIHAGRMVELIKKRMEDFDYASN